MSTSGNPENEFSRIFCRINVPKTGLSAELIASGDECDELARRLDVVELSKLKADVVVERWRRNGLKVSGSFEAHLVQTCVVSLDEFESVTREEFAARFAEADDPILNSDATAAAEVVIDPDAEDDPEVLVDGCADVGELVVSLLAISLDPHPRKPGITLEDVLPGHGEQVQGADDERENPFAILRDLKATKGE